MERIIQIIILILLVVGITTDLSGQAPGTPPQIEECPPFPITWEGCDTMETTFTYDNDQLLYDFEIPPFISEIILEVKGGDGGDADSDQGDRSGGEGATMIVSIPITDTSRVQPGGTLRFVPGQVGGTDGGPDAIGDRNGGGGGASGVWYLCEDCDPVQSWQVVAVGGGGGGARVSLASTFTNGYPGGGGRTNSQRTSNMAGETQCFFGQGGGGFSGFVLPCVGPNGAFFDTIYPASRSSGGDCERTVSVTPRCFVYGGYRFEAVNGGDSGGNGWAGGGAGTLAGAGGGGGFQGGNGGGNSSGGQGGYNFYNPCIGVQQLADLAGADEGGTESDGYIKVQFIDGPPLTFCKDSFTVQIPESGQTQIQLNQIEDLVLDWCGIDTTFINRSAFTCSDVGFVDVVLTATDVNNQSSTCTTVVEVLPFAGITAARSLRFSPPTNGEEPASIRVDAGTIDPSQMTVEFWFNADDLLGTEPIVSTGSINMGEGFGVRIGYDKIQVTNYFNASNTIFPFSFEDNRWYHVALTVSGAQYTAYVDGTLVQTIERFEIAPTADTLWWGHKRQGNASPFGGFLDDLRLWTVVRSESEINAYKDEELLGWEEGLLVYLPLNDGTFGVGSPNELKTITANLAGTGDGVLTDFQLDGCLRGWSTSSPGLTEVVGISRDTFAAASENGPTDGTWLIRRSGYSPSGLNVGVSTSGTATQGNDYLAPSGVVIPSYTYESEISFQVFEDAIPELPETVIGTIQPGAGYSPTSNNSLVSAQQEILNNDVVKVSVEATDNEMFEFFETTDGSFFESQFTVKLEQSLPFPVTLDLKYTGTATRSVDYESEITGPVDTTLFVPAMTESVTINLTSIVNDEIVEGTETIILEAQNDGIIFPVVPDNNMISVRDTIFIIDNDTAIIGSNGVQDAFLEGESGVITFETDKLCSNPITISIDYTGPASEGVDYTTSHPEQVVIPALTQSVDVTVESIQEQLVEFNELIFADVSDFTATGAVNLSPNPVFQRGTAVISNDDTAQALIYAPIDTVLEMGSSIARFVLFLTRPAGAPITFFYNVEGSASNGADYEFIPNSTTFPLGEQAVVLDVPISNDAIVEGDESIILSLTGVSGPPDIELSFPLRDTVIIKDDDACLSSGNNRVYVSTTGNNSDGSSWANAFTELQPALDAALSCTSADNIAQVWVAQGTYVPTADTTGSTDPSDVRSRTFFINDNIEVYGGFAGNESSLFQRDTSNRTILSGDIDNTPGDVGNAYIVMTLHGTQAVITNDCIIDGFVIEGGNADNLNDNYARGGGIFSITSSPLIRNCTFDNNNAFISGGALNFDGQAGAIPPRVKRSIFKNNTAGSGGAIGASNGLTTYNFEVENCVFESNTGSFGGAVYHSDAFGTTCSPKYTNCLFVKNTGGFGGAMGNTGLIDITVVNCTFAQNYADSDGGAVYSDGGEGGFDPNLNPSYFNNILWGNSSQFDPADQMKNFFVTPSHGNSIIQGSGGSSNWVDMTEDGFGIGNDGGGNLDTSPMFTDSVGCDFTLQSLSPAVNAGSTVVNPTALDIAGNLRVTGEVIDIGAYEFGKYSFIPDDGFEQALINQGIDTDGVLNDSVLTADISSLLSLQLVEQGIEDMTGIQDFIALESLIVAINPIDSLKLSHNMNLQILDVAFCSEIEYLDVSSTNVTSLQLATLTDLESLNCSHTNIVGLDLSANDKLTTVDVSNNPMLTFLDVRNGQNGILTSFDSRQTPSLTCIEVDAPSEAAEGDDVFGLWLLDPGNTFKGGFNVWTGGAGDWLDASNWSLGRVPGVCENVVIDAINATDTVTIQSIYDIDILNLTVLSGELMLESGAKIDLKN